MDGCAENCPGEGQVWKEWGKWEGRGVWSDLPQLSAFSQCEKPSLELLDLMFLKMLSSIPSCVAACSHKMFSAVFRHFEQLHNSGFNTFDICLFFFFPPYHLLLNMLWLGNAKLGSVWRFCDTVISLELTIKVQTAFIQALGWRSKRQHWLCWNKMKKEITFEYWITYLVHFRIIFWENLGCSWFLFVLL